MRQLSRSWVFCLILVFFFISYTTLSLVRHNHYLSYGYDLGIDDQIVWQYSQFRLPITTIDNTPFSLSLTNHVELIYALAAPAYWFWNSVNSLLILQVLVIVISGIPIYLLARKYKLKSILCYALLISYLSFFGIQNALWFDVHSAPFGAAFLAWFIYFLDIKKWKWAWISFILTIICKENFAAMTFLVSITYYIITRNKYVLIFAGASLLYLLFIFGIYFPHLVAGGYMYQAKGGLLSGMNPWYMFNTPEKMGVYLYSFSSFGFLPLLNPFMLIPFFGNLALYFVFGREVSGAQGLFLHYRVELAPLIAFATILTIQRFKFLNKTYIAIYLILCALLVQYILHLPLSYLAKSWFWQQPAAVVNINNVLKALPKNASVVSQNNITPHISHRTDVFSLMPQQIAFTKNSPCPKVKCNWFSWGGSPKYLIVDTSKDWDIRHFLANREDYVEGLNNLEKMGYIKKYKQQGNAVLYKVLKNP
jgi:uncharacterized membrane protein